MKKSSENDDAKANEHAHCEKCGGTGYVQTPVPIDEALLILQNIFKKLSKLGKSATESKVDGFLADGKIVFPKSGTKPCDDFFRSLSEIDSFLSFIIDLIARVESAYSTIEGLVTDGNGKIEYQDQKTGERYSVKTPRPYSFMYAFAEKRQFILEVIVVRLVENYLNYLSSLLYEIFIQKPETMKSGEKIEISSVLSHDSFKSLIRTIAEKKISNLTYSSFKELASYFSDRFKLKVCSETAINQITFAIELRNISVHNRCRIDQRFIERTNYDPATKDKIALLNLEFINKLVPVLVKSVLELDTAARSKLKLRGKRFSSTADKNKGKGLAEFSQFVDHVLDEYRAKKKRAGT